MWPVTEHQKDGWVLFEPATSRYPDRFSEFLKVTAPERKLTFIKNGIILAVAISKPKGEPRISTIEYARWIPEYSVPVPPESNYLEFRIMPIIKRSLRDLAAALF